MGEYVINKAKCRGCGLCMNRCPGATKISEDHKAEIIDEAKLKECGGTSVCPFGAIESSSGVETERNPVSPSQFRGRGFGRGGRGMRFGRGMGRGSGRRGRAF